MTQAFRTLGYQDDDAPLAYCQSGVVESFLRLVQV